MFGFEIAVAIAGILAGSIVFAGCLAGVGHDTQREITPRLFIVSILIAIISVAFLGVQHLT